jgi:hypothetical protein
VRARQHHHRIPVWRGPGDIVARKDASAPNRILDHDWLPNAARQRVPNQAADQIGASARRETDNQAQRPGRPFLRGCVCHKRFRGNESDKRCRGEIANAPPDWIVHSIFPLLLFSAR